MLRENQEVSFTFYVYLRNDQPGNHHICGGGIVYLYDSAGNRKSRDYFENSFIISAAGVTSDSLTGKTGTTEGTFTLKHKMPKGSKPGDPMTIVYSLTQGNSYYNYDLIAYYKWTQVD